MTKETSICANCGHDYQHYHKFNTDEQCSHWERRAEESPNVVYCPCKKFIPKAESNHSQDTKTSLNVERSAVPDAPVPQRVSKNISEEQLRGISLSDKISQVFGETEDDIRYLKYGTFKDLKRTETKINNLFREAVQKILERIDNTVCRKCGDTIKHEAYCWEKHMDTKHKNIKYKDFAPLGNAWERWFRDLDKAEFREIIKSEMGRRLSE